MYNHKKYPYIVQIILFTVMVILLATACGRQEDPPAPSQVEVIAKEFLLEHEVKIVSAGEVTFVVKNEGTVEHNFVIEGVEETIESIFSQEEKSLIVNLSTGTYQLVCNLPGHQEAGMVSEITVE